MFLSVLSTSRFKFVASASSVAASPAMGRESFVGAVAAKEAADGGAGALDCAEGGWDV